MADPALIFSVALSALNLVIGFYVYLRDRGHLVNKVFAATGAAISLWTLGIGLAHSPLTASLLFVRCTFAAGALAFIALPTLFAVFPSSPFPRTRAFYSFTATGFFLVGIAFTPLLVREVESISPALTLSYGPAHPIFGLYTYACLGYCLVTLWRKLRTATGFERLQLRYLLLGLLLPAGGATITNVLIPLLSGESRFGRYGPAFTLAFVGLTGHAIIRHRLMNIRLVVSRSVEYLVSFWLAGVALAIVIEFTSLVFPYPRLRLSLWTEIALILPIAILFQPIHHIVRNALDHYLYRRPYDYERAIRDFSTTIGAMLKLAPLLDSVCDVIGRTVQPEHVSVYLKSPEASFDYEFVAHRNFLAALAASAPGESLPGASAVARHFADRGGPLLREEVKRAAQISGDPLLEEMKRLDAECVYPIFDYDRIAGFLVLGPKLSGDPYFSEDLSLLTTLVNQALVAIKNAYLYREVVAVNEYVENILAVMDSGVIAVAADGTVTLFNQAAERLTGLQAKYVKNSILTKLPIPLAEFLHLTLEARQPQLQREASLTSVSGHSRSVVCSTSLLIDSAAAVRGAVAVVNDVSRLKELEEEKLRAQRLVAIGALAAGVAHEIKNPLVAIRTFAELLPERFAEPEFQHDFAKLVIREVGRIDGLVSRLRVMASPASEGLCPLDLREPISETLALLRGQLEQSRVSVHADFGAEPPLILGNAAQLKQLFLNLLVNAIEAMKPGGEVTVRVCQSAGWRLGVVVEVIDNGTGFPEWLLNKVFDPFVTTKERGSGLGLSICRGIVDVHRGWIQVRNNVEGGATVVIEFPVVSPGLESKGSR